LEKELEIMNHLDRIQKKNQEKIDSLQEEQDKIVKMIQTAVKEKMEYIKKIKERKENSTKLQQILDKELAQLYRDLLKRQKLINTGQKKLYLYQDQILDIENRRLEFFREFTSKLPMGGKID
jgi:seryl-tRNA synthetase